MEAAASSKPAASTPPTPTSKPSPNNVQYSIANIRGIALNRYLVNTEGTIVRQGYTGYNGAISVGGQASDGMRLSRDNGTVASSAKDLESASAFRKRVIDDLKSFDELRNAPVVSAEDYHGPVLFSGDAAADVFNRLFVPNVEADRPEMGTTARTTGAYSSSLQVSRASGHSSASPTIPLETKFNGKSLLGAYAIDDEGVPAQSVNVVDNGKLENFLIGREPIKDFSTSNGHGRAAPAQARTRAPASSSSNPTSPSQRTSSTSACSPWQRSRAKTSTPSKLSAANSLPRLLYRVHPDGTRQLVRGAVFDELDNRSLRSGIIAAGNDPYISNSLGAVPQTTIAPSILFDDIGVKRATVEQQKLPYYPPPPVPGK